MANVTNGSMASKVPSQASETNGHLYIANDNLKRIADALEDKYQTITDGLYIQQGSLNRIANALEKIIDMIEKDQEESKKRWAESEKD